MARPISDEELELKKRARRRLIGAIVLATAVAVILPMVLDTEPKPVSSNVDIQIPSPDGPQHGPKPRQNKLRHQIPLPRRKRVKAERRDPRADEARRSRRERRYP